MKYFCAQCGKTTLYNFELPKFCSSCGKSFSKKLDDNKIQANLDELKLKKINNINTYEDHNTHPEINFKKVKPSFKLSQYKNEGESFGSILENPSKPVDQIDKHLFSSQVKTREEILEEFKKEAGALRPE